METAIRLFGYILAAGSGFWIASLAVEHNDYKIGIAAFMAGLSGLIFGADNDR